MDSLHQTYFSNPHIIQYVFITSTQRAIKHPNRIHHHGEMACERHHSPCLAAISIIGMIWFSLEWMIVVRDGDEWWWTTAVTSHSSHSSHYRAILGNLTITSILQFSTISKHFYAIDDSFERWTNPQMNKLSFDQTYYRYSEKMPLRWNCHFITFSAKCTPLSIPMAQCSSSF